MTDRYSSQSIDGGYAAEHVQRLYDNGYTYQKTIRKVKRATELVSNDDSVGGDGDGTGAHSKATIPRNTLLNQLNRYPALILNADYQVRYVVIVCFLLSSGIPKGTNPKHTHTPPHPPKKKSQCPIYP